jgi:hypothetical protein
LSLPGASYLFALATVSITFVGFSALLIVWTLLGVQAAAGVALLLTTLGLFPRLGHAVYATAVTAVLLSSGVAYLIALSVILPDLTHRGK